jgi:hypothetical protein
MKLPQQITPVVRRVEATPLLGQTMIVALATETCRTRCNHIEDDQARSLCMKYCSGNY